MWCSRHSDNMDTPHLQSTCGYPTDKCSSRDLVYNISASVIFSPSLGQPARHILRPCGQLHVTGCPSPQCSCCSTVCVIEPMSGPCSSCRICNLLVHVRPLCLLNKAHRLPGEHRSRRGPFSLLYHHRSTLSLTSPRSTKLSHCPGLSRLRTWSQSTSTVPVPPPRVMIAVGSHALVSQQVSLRLYV